MFVHVDPQLFEKRPFFLIVLAMVGLIVWIVLVGFLYREYRGFGPTPASVDLNTVLPPAENHGQWVAIQQALLIRCSPHLQEIRQPPESWMFGRVDQTMFVATIEGSGRGLLLVQNGDISCKEVADRPMVGVLEEISPYWRGEINGAGVSVPPRTDLQLSLGEGPASYRKMFVISLFFPVICVFLLMRAWPKWRAQVNQRESLVSAFRALD